MNAAIGIASSATPRRDVGGDDDRQLAHAVEQHAGVQRHQRERQRLERDQHAHLQRRRVQQQRRRQRQREVGDLRAERRDRQRRPELPEIRRPPEPAERTAQAAVAAYPWMHLFATRARERSHARRARHRAERGETGNRRECERKCAVIRIPPHCPAGNPAGRLLRYDDAARQRASAAHRSANRCRDARAHARRSRPAGASCGNRVMGGRSNVTCVDARILRRGASGATRCTHRTTVRACRLSRRCDVAGDALQLRYFAGARAAATSMSRYCHGCSRYACFL